MGKRSKLATFSIGLAIGGIALWLAVRDIRFDEVGSALKSANFLYTLPFVLLLCLFYWLKAGRWQRLLKPARELTIRDVFAPMIIGFAGNNVLPIRLGELLRIYLLGKEFEIPKTTVLATLVLERVFDAICILGLVAAVLVSTHIAVGDLVSGSVALGTVAILAIGLVVVLVRPPRTLRSMAKRVGGWLPEKAHRAAKSHVNNMRQGLSAIASPFLIFRLTINSLVQWLLLAVCIAISFVALDVDADPTAAIIILGLIVLGISLPGAPGFIGTIELCFVIGLGLFGVDKSQALAVAIFYHVLTFGFVTLAGTLFLPRYRGLWKETGNPSLVVKNYKR